MKKLTTKQKIFVEKYLANPNAKRAALAAGYSKKTAQQMGYENLTKPLVITAIQKAMDKRSKKTEITAEFVLRTIKETVEKDVLINDSPNIYRGCDLLGKHLKLFTDKIDHSFDANAPLVIKIEKTVINARDNDNK